MISLHKHDGSRQQRNRWEESSQDRKRLSAGRRGRSGADPSRWHSVCSLKHLHGAADRPEHHQQKDGFIVMPPGLAKVPGAVWKLPEVQNSPRCSQNIDTLE